MKEGGMDTQLVEYICHDKQVSELCFTILRLELLIYMNITYTYVNCFTKYRYSKLYALIFIVCNFNLCYLYYLYFIYIR